MEYRLKGVGLYYLNGRYYDAEVKRFVSRDAQNVLAVAPAAFSDKNLYAYCDNNPVLRIDEGGKCWHIIAGAALGFASQYVSNVIGGVLDGEAFGEALRIEAEDVPGLVGATLSGAVTATGITAGGLSIVNAAINTTSYLAECEITGQTVNKRKLAINIGIGIVIDARGEGGIDGKRLRGVWKTANQKIKNSKSVKKNSNLYSKEEWN